MAIAPADADVTCIIYATADSHFTNNFKIVTHWKIFLRALDELTKEAVGYFMWLHLLKIFNNLILKGKDSMSSPIYNAEWMTEDAVYNLMHL